MAFHTALRELWKTTVIQRPGLRTRQYSVLVQDAKQRGIESGTQVRIDSTATDADILEPSDSRLLFDGVRVLTELLRQARERLARVSFRDHCRAAKRRHREIGSQRDGQAASSHLPAAAALDEADDRLRAGCAACGHVRRI